jgi:tetratricopeptide (TPR) repeat protein
MRRIFPIFLLICIFLSASADDQRFTNANNLYTEGNFEEAIAAYEEVSNTGMESAALYFNLANAYYKTGQLPHAILNYERAKLLAPNDKDIAYNLELARSQTTDKIEMVGTFFLKKWIQSLINKGDSDFWAYLTIACFWGFIVTLFLFFFTQSSVVKKAGFFLGIVFLTASICCYSFSHGQKQKLVNRQHAIVFSPSVTVKSSPDASGTELFVLHEGTKVKVLSELGEWCQIELLDGNVGWLNVSTIERI